MGISGRETTSWENWLEYRIGRIEARLITRYADTDADERFLIFFTLRRYFGAR